MKPPPAPLVIRYLVQVDPGRRRLRGVLAREYASGLRHGAITTLDHITGGPEAHGEPYTGPIPDELRAWITERRARIEADNVSEQTPPVTGGSDAAS